MNCNNVGDPLTFPLAPSSKVSLCQILLRPNTCKTNGIPISLLLVKGSFVHQCCYFIDSLPNVAYYLFCILSLSNTNIDNIHLYMLYIYIWLIPLYVLFNVSSYLLISRHLLLFTLVNTNCIALYWYLLLAMTKLNLSLYNRKYNSKPFLAVKVAHIS